MSQWFQNAQNVSIDGSPLFQHVEGDMVTHISHYHAGHGSSSMQDRQAMLPVQNQYREIRRGDIDLQTQVWSEDMKMIMERYIATTNPFRKRAELTAVSIRKKVYTAQIIDLGERLFTVVTFEPENKEDKQIIQMIWRRVYEASATHTSPWFTQLFALGRSNLPMFIMRDELANGREFSDRYRRDAVVLDYLEYTRMTSIEALRADKALSTPVVAAGGFGDLWKGTCNGRSVGLKCMKVFLCSNIGTLCMEFCKEVLLWKRLNHRFVLPLLGIAHFLKSSKHDTSGDILVTLLYEVSQGIEYLHSEGVIHGDIKGVNILIDDEGHPVLTDFGLTFLRNAQYDPDGPKGTLRWIAPELLGGNSDPTFASDIYSFGHVCIEVYTGKQPFDELRQDIAVMFHVVKGERPPRPPRMPKDVWALVNRCWDQQSDLRPSAQEVYRELARIVGGCDSIG
ncbi:hypothetical protein PM082_016613 [Marasmius tenuissimus]|nr:hypothetical protein PM082_016613 [Marasmius tenuissimus]